MKSLLYLFLLLSLSVSAQTAFRRAAFRIDSLPKQGILLDKGWKFHAGDNPDWAKADFDDSAWESIDPTKDIMDLPQIFDSKIKWLRLSFEVKNKLPNPLGIAVSQAGASEIYLNGRLVHQFGHFDTDSTKVKAHDPLQYPIYFPADSVGKYVLAVRYALQPNIRYTKIYGQTKNHLFGVTLLNVVATLNAKRGFNRYYMGLEIFVVGVFFMLFVLHSTFYVFQKSNKTHLLFAVYVLGIIAVRIFKLIGENQFSVEYRYYTLNTSNCFLAISVLCLGGVYYRIANTRLDYYYYAFVAFQLIYVLVSAFNYGFPWQTILLLIGSIYGFIISIRLIRIGLKKEIKGFLILSIALLFAVFGLLARTVAVLFLNYGISLTGYNDLNYGISPILVELIFTTGAVAIPISLSVFMGIEANEVNRALNQQLLENDQLKNKAIEQEREKQQILTTQNETLEKQVKERTAELEHKNRELEIEASLEKVRSRSLSMHHSHEIQDVAYVMYGEFKKLNFQFGACSVYLINDNGDIESWVAGFGDNEYPQSFKVPYFDHPIYNGYIEAFRAGKKYETYLLSEDIKPAYDDQMFHHSEYKNLPEKLIQLMRNLPSAVFSMAYNKYGALHWGPGELNADEANIIQRFSAVFEQAYTRFLDLQKAEAQAREAQIEAALERVRSRSLAMRTSQELKDVITVVIKQFVELGFDLDLANFNYISSPKEWVMWLATPEYTYPEILRIPAFAHPLFDRPIQTVMQGQSFMSDVLTKEEYETIWRHFYGTSLLNEYDSAERKKYVSEGKGLARSIVFMKKIALTISNFKAVPYTNEQNAILRRFGQVFEQAYIRFLDLQKAEAQAREAQIEAALEKVRSASLAIHHSHELENVVVVLFDKLNELGIPFNAAFIYLFDKPTRNIESWVATNMLPTPIKVNMPYDESVANNPIIVDLWYAIENGEHGLNKVYKEKDKDDYYRYEAKHNPSIIPASVTDLQLEAESWTTTFASEKNSIVGFDSWGGQLTTTEDFQTLKRFAKVFEQAYIRFLDLQKAEAQAREAQIEAALERIRSRTLAMQQSNELKEIVAMVHVKMKELNVILGTIAFWFFDKNTMNSTFWVANELQHEDLVLLPYDEKTFNEDTNYRDGWQSRFTGEDLINRHYNKTQIHNYFEYVFANNSLTTIPQNVREFIMQAESHIVSLLVEKNTILCVDSWTGQEYSAEMISVLKRATKVFEQAYVRFLDLQKAEEQAREAKIEAALERVRSRTMAMQHSEELGETAKLLFQQVQTLGIPAWSCGYNIWEKDEKVCTGWMSSNGILQPPFRIPLTESPSFIRQYESKQKGEDFYAEEVGGEALVAHYQYMGSLPDFGEILKHFLKSGFTLPNFQINHIVNFKHGNMVFITGEPVPEAHDIFKRFAKVFEQTYTRFLDLQKAEAQAREAHIEAALERIRSRAMAMDTSEELNTLIGFIYTECTKLNMHLDRGFIMTFNKATKDAYWWMVSADASDNPLKILVNYHEYAPNLAILKGWEAREQRWSYVLEGNNKKTWDDYQFANALSQLPDFVKDNMRSVKSVILNASFQNFGCIMLSSFEPLSDDHFDLLMRLSKVFDLTYTRFLDLQLKEQSAIKLLEEKQKLEHTLSELQTTQTQLIQKEKLASLGELTAGIAHEIQNPLNFVNNFSEMSVELANELKEEAEKPEMDKELIIDLASDLAQNQAKINHHGKRASSIVSNMLEHSRTSTGERMMTDLNKLADEYLRLSYHGMRAKYKNFNADYELIADENLPLVNVVPQDIGRVLLNLINNAFYAVGKKEGGKVTISTRPLPAKEGRGDRRFGGVMIAVQDNGAGIPADILPKIFQPFFTTKPTGEGTGLGLSLAYDIVTKGHGGTLEVEGVEGQGAMFILKLPI